MSWRRCSRVEALEPIPVGPPGLGRLHGLGPTDCLLEWAPSGATEIAVDGDGDADLAIGVVASTCGGVLRGIEVLSNNGGGGFTTMASYVIGDPTFDSPPLRSLVAADLDRDGDLDLAGLAEVWRC